LDYMTTSGVTVSLLSTSDTLGAQKAAYSASSRSTIPDASLSKEDRDVMLTLSPAFKERFQRFQAVYHVRIVWLERDAIEVVSIARTRFMDHSTMATGPMLWP
jgi:hypothetical protein